MKLLKKKLKMNRLFALGEVTQRCTKKFPSIVRSSGHHKNLAHHKLQIINILLFYWF